MIDKIEVQGLAELEKKLTMLGADMGWPVLRVACREAMKPVKQQMQQNAPFDEDPNREEGPHMRDKVSMTTRKGGSRSSKNTAAVTRVGPTKPHSQKAIAAEYGTEKQVAEPFMRPSLFDNRHTVVNKFTEVLRAKLIEASQ